MSLLSVFRAKIRRNLNEGNHQVFQQVILKGEVSLSVDPLFDWFGLVCFANKNKNGQ